MDEGSVQLTQAVVIDFYRAVGIFQEDMRQRGSPGRGTAITSNHVVNHEKGMCQSLQDTGIFPSVLWTKQINSLPSSLDSS